eukprot:m51a1_g168 putative cysteine proteinase rd19a-like (3682) ;mRNA; r:545786-559930
MPAPGSKITKPGWGFVHLSGASGTPQSSDKSPPLCRSWVVRLDGGASVDDSAPAYLRKSVDALGALLPREVAARQQKLALAVAQDAAGGAFLVEAIPGAPASAAVSDSACSSVPAELVTLGLVHAASLASGLQPREALHVVLGAWLGLPADTRASVVSALRSVSVPGVDPRRTWAIFFEDAAEVSSRFATLPPAEIELALVSDPTPGDRDELKAVLNHRDKLVSWLMANSLIELPYDREAMRAALRNVDVDADTRRRACYASLRSYDYAAESRNVERVSTYVRDEMVPPEFPQPVLLVGRESRAFGNQAYLMACTALIECSDQLRKAVSKLSYLGSGAEFNSSLSALLPSRPKTVKQMSDLVVHLGPGISRLNQLVSNKVFQPMTQYRGALQSVREQIEIVHCDGRVILNKAMTTAALESSEDPISVLAPSNANSCSATALRSALRKAQAALDQFCGAGGQLAQALGYFEDRLEECRKHQTSFSVLLQRLTPFGADKFRANECAEKPEQEPDLRKLVRLGGDRVYMSASFEWIDEATDVIEAVPLFIYERTTEVDGLSKTEFHVDQEGLEQTIRLMAPHLAENIRRTMDSEYVALGREVAVHRRRALLDKARVLIEAGGIDPDAAFLIVFREAAGSDKALVSEACAVASWLRRTYDTRIEDCEARVESQWNDHCFIDRMASVRAVLIGDGAILSPSYESQCARAHDAAFDGTNEEDAKQFYAMALRRRRSVPAFHLLTTEAPGLMEAFVQTVLEEQMSLANVVRARGLEAEVRQRAKSYASRIAAVASTVIEEFGYGPLLERYAEQSASVQDACLKLVGEHSRVQDEVAILAVLADAANAIAPEQVSLGDTAAAVSLATAHPALCLGQRVKRYVRDHTALANTVAAREVIAERGLAALCLDPRYAFSSGSASGRRKRYHLIYGPSRVNLGRGELASVHQWSQWAGVSDPLAASHARRFYEHINHKPVVRAIRETENLKVSENQWTALIRSVRNCQALFVERESTGDIELLEYEFSQRAGLATAARKLRENYSAGPTAGYCIPKDLLFKAFVVTLQQREKLSQIGIAEHLHGAVIRAARELVCAKGGFASEGEWERWAARQFLEPASLMGWIAPSGDADDARRAADTFRRYVETTGGAALNFNLPKLASVVLGQTGVPHVPVAAANRDLSAITWASWAERKVSLGGEQVNRSLVFPFARGIFKGAHIARKLNPTVNVAEDSGLRLHMFGAYKGDEDYPAPPDVRFAMPMRVFMILAGHSHEVSLCLDEEGQVLAFLTWHGFQPESTDPMHRRATALLASRFTGREQFDPVEDADIISRLREEFPPQPTVADITITAVPGVSTEDLLGFNAETKALLSGDAARAAELLAAYGVNAEQMKANAQLRRRFPDEWAPLNKLPQSDLEFLRTEVGHTIHSLVLKLRGPGSHFSLDLQANVVMFGCPHMELMGLEPTELRDLMLTGRPGSALVVLDYVVQGKKRVWSDRDVMTWLAACRGVDAKGREVSSWTDRDQHGRRGVYLAFGKGTEDVAPSLGLSLYEQVRFQEHRAMRLYRCAEDLARSPSSADAAQALRRCYYEEFRAPRCGPSLEDELDHAREYEQQVILKGRFRPRDRIVRQVLEHIVAGAPAESFGEAEWLAVGGMFLLNGTPAMRQQQVLQKIRAAQAALCSRESTTVDERVSKLIVSKKVGATFAWLEQKREMFSVKASEQSKETAVARRKALATASREKTWRQQLSEGSADAATLVEKCQSDDETVTVALTETRKILSELTESHTIAGHVLTRVGKALGLCSRAAMACATIVLKGADCKKAISAASKLAVDGQLSNDAWRSFGGTYENCGIISCLFDSAKTPEAERTVLALCELLYTALALSKTAKFLDSDSDASDAKHLWRALAEFFAETIDDHYSEYNPWFLDPKRCPRWAREFYDTLGFALPGEPSERLYSLSWSVHRCLYPYLRSLIATRTSFASLPGEEADALLGNVTLSADGSNDAVSVCAVGASAPAKWELLWRAYNQLREFAFIANDGFALPVVALSVDPDSPALRCSRRVNHVFLYPVGRTHISRALMEGPTMRANLFVTRDGTVADDGHGPLVCIRDAHVWLSEEHAVEVLRTHKGMSSQQAHAYLRAEEGRLTAKGVRFAMGFSRPVWAGSVCCFHHHRLESEVYNHCRYPSTDKSRVLFDLTYNKSLYPSIYRAEGVDVDLPPEIDWMQEHTTQLERSGTSRERCIDEIANRLRAFGASYKSIICKGAAESGARNLQRFDLLDAATGGVDERRVAEAAQFVYQISKSQNVTIQRAVIATPFAWMDSSAIAALVERQQIDWALALHLDTHPKDAVYGTLRVILSCGVPSADLTDPDNWAASHTLFLCSTQVATNVGRQGTLEVLTEAHVRPEFRGAFIKGLVEAGKRSMVAVARFAKRYWSEPVLVEGVTLPSYVERNPGDAETDACGVPYAWPRYLMLDFLPEPVFKHPASGIVVPENDYDVIDVTPGVASLGTQSQFIIRQRSTGEQFEPAIAGFKFWLLEPNVGIGLWPNYWRREVVLEQQRCEAQRSAFDWSRVGVSDRLVVGNFLAAGRAFLQARGNELEQEDFSSPVAPVSSEASAGERSSAAVQSKWTWPFTEALGALHTKARNLQSVEERELSSLLVETALRVFAHTPEPGQHASVLESVRAWLCSPECVVAFARAAASGVPVPIGVTPDAFQGFVRDPVFSSRIAELVLDALMSEPLAPPTILRPRAATQDEMRALVPQGRMILAVVCGKRPLMSHHLWPWVSNESEGVCVVGVHTHWLTGDAKAERFVAYDRKAGVFVEASTPRGSPLRLNRAFIVELPASTELQDFETLSTWLSAAGVALVNPLAESLERAADKSWLVRHPVPGVAVPRTVCVAPGTAPSAIAAIVSQIASESAEGIIVKAARGTTEGASVRWFAQGECVDAAAYAAEVIAAHGGAMVSTYEGRVTYRGCPLVLRFNVVSSLCETHVTCSAVVGHPGARVATLGQRDDVPRVGDVLASLSLCLHSGEAPRAYAATREDYARAEEMAVKAAHATGLRVAGVDVALVPQPASGVSCVVLEVNARPGTLVFAEQDKFKLDFGRVYSTPEEERFRLSVFANTLAQIAALQATQPEATFAVNQFSDMTDEEFKAMYLSGLLDNDTEDPANPSFEPPIPYKDDGVDRFRLSVFANTLAQIAALQATQPEATFAVNQFSDMTDEEFKAMYLSGLLDNDTEDPANPSFEPPIPYKDDGVDVPIIRPLPPVIRPIVLPPIDPITIDINTRDLEPIAKRVLPSSYMSPYQTPVKNQGGCGSCWAFAATALVEHAWNKANGKNVSLSEQQMLECTSGSCSGGLAKSAIEYIYGQSRIGGGQMPSKDYAYTAVDDGVCNAVGYKAAASISDWGVVAGDETFAMPNALVTYGSLGVSLNADLLKSYSSGVITGTAACDKAVNHAVVIVGYTSDHWIVKNSWGSWWGEHGYFRIKKGTNACRITYRGGLWAKSSTCAAYSGFACAYGIEIGNDGFWGIWGALGLCPSGTFATGFQTQSEPVQGAGDDTAANGVRLLCGNSYTPGPTSLVGPWGTWDTAYGCPPGYYLTDFQLMVESPVGSGDDTAANRMRVRCRKEDGTLFPLLGESNSKTSWGAWTQWYSCPIGYAVVGIRTRVEPSQGAGDDTSLNAVRLRCKRIRPFIIIPINL